MSENTCSMRHAKTFTTHPCRWRQFICAGLIAIALPATADVIESLEYRYYKVEPHWAEPLSRSVIKATPIRENGKPYLGITAWTVNWEVQREQRPSGNCALSKVRTRLHSIITLPQVVLDDAEDQAHFDQFLEALKHHELGHVDIASDAANEIDRRLQRMPAMASCDALNNAVNELGQAQLKVARRLGVQYDVDTGHGKTQGAVLK